MCIYVCVCLFKNGRVWSYDEESCTLRGSDQTKYYALLISFFLVGAPDESGHLFPEFPEACKIPVAPYI